MQKRASSEITLHSAFCILQSAIRRRIAGTAAIETAIVMPLYMLITWGLIYFGYATLTRQRQDVAAAYATMKPGVQRADDMISTFMPWAGKPATGQNLSTAGYLTVAATETARQGDEYYGKEIASQALSGAHSIAGGGNPMAGGQSQVFDYERIGVGLWNYALGRAHVSHPFGGAPEIWIQHNDFTDYLNAEYNSTGFVQASIDYPLGSIAGGLADYSGFVGNAFNGAGGAWMQRRTTTVDATYKPPFFQRMFAADGDNNSSFRRFVTSDYADAGYTPTGSISFDATVLSGQPRGGNNPISDARWLMNESSEIPGANALDETVSVNGRMLRDLWSPQVFTQ